VRTLISPRFPGPTVVRELPRVNNASSPPSQLLGDQAAAWVSAIAVRYRGRRLSHGPSQGRRITMQRVDRGHCTRISPCNPLPRPLIRSGGACSGERGSSRATGTAGAKPAARVSNSLPCSVRRWGSSAGRARAHRAGFHPAETVSNTPVLAAISQPPRVSNNGRARMGPPKHWALDASRHLCPLLDLWPATARRRRTRAKVSCPCRSLPATQTQA